MPQDLGFAGYGLTDLSPARIAEKRALVPLSLSSQFLASFWHGF